VSFGGVEIGEFRGGDVDSSDLVMTLNANATPAATTALLKAITFSTETDNPVADGRMVRVWLTDGDGGTSSAIEREVRVTPSNDAPQISAGSGRAAWTENTAPVPIAPDLLLTDIDSADFDTGTLTVSLSAGGVATDRLTLLPEGDGAGQVNLVGASVHHGGIWVGTLAGSSTSSGPLTITFRSEATPAIAQAVARRVGFRNVGENPTATLRTVSFALTDGDRGQATPATRQIEVTPVNDGPVISALGADVTWREGAAASLLAPAGVITDPDSPTWGGGFLRISLTEGATADDLLAVRNQGTGTGQIGVTGQDVLFGNIKIGTTSGGLGGTELTIQFESTASLAAVQALLRNITFRVTGSVSQNSTRRVQFIAEDGAGGTSPAVTKGILVING